MPAGLVVLDIDTNTIKPFTGNTVTVNGVALRTLPGANPSTLNQYIGTNAPSSMTGDTNLMVGSGGSGITTGEKNTVVGLFSGGALQDGSDNVIVGATAMTNANTSSENIAIGSLSIGLITNSSFGQVAIGHHVLRNLTSVTADGNTAIGWRALWNATACGGNTVLGYSAGTSVTTGSFNTLIGPSAGGNLTTGSNNICIGKYVFPATATTSDSITLGNSSNNILRCAVTSITSLSDARDKEDVKDLSTGLDFVKSLRPVEFTWNDRDEAGKHGVADFGFIAQDLKKAQEDAEKAEVLKLVYEENPEKLEASYGKLIPILVKAIQELSAEVTSLKKK